MMNKSSILLLFFVSLASLKLTGEYGLNHDGVSEAENLPDTWNETENVLWKTPLFRRFFDASHH